MNKSTAATLFEKFPSIDCFRTYSKEVFKYCKQEDDSYPIFTYRGTVKLHGRNAGLILTEDAVNYQSRNRVLTLEQDSAGFVQFMSEKNRAELIKNFFWNNLDEGLEAEKIIVYGEFCGSSIQGRVALTELPKHFVIFWVQLFLKNKDKPIWIQPPTQFEDPFNSTETQLYFITKVPPFEITINFNELGDTVERLQAMTDEVEKECPWAASFGVSGLGEGIVWSTQHPESTKIYSFKTKGQKHSKHKVSGIEATKFAKIQEFGDAVLTEARYQQGLDYLTEMNIEHDIKYMGVYIQWVRNDIEKEESDLLDDSVDFKKVRKYLNGKIASFYRNYIKTKVDVLY